MLGGLQLYGCYIDEAGCTGELSGPASAVQPAFVLNGLIAPAGRIESLTRAWIQIKQAYRDIGIVITDSRNRGR